MLSIMKATAYDRSERDLDTQVSWMILVKSFAFNINSVYQALVTINNRYFRA